jgi:hypothetical protein
MPFAGFAFPLSVHAALPAAVAAAGRLGGVGVALRGPSLAATPVAGARPSQHRVG